jgi:hypothetical protein
MAYDRNGVINRVLDDENLALMKRDMKPLLRRVRDSKGELLIFLRDNSFNVYYRGNSLAQIAFPPGGTSAQATYRVTIRWAFVEKSKLEVDPVVAEFAMSVSSDGKSVIYDVTASELRVLLKAVHIADLCKRIRTVDYSEELAFEQKLIADNMDRDDLVIIDRQVVLYDMTPQGRRRRCIDVLALQQVEGNSYRFLVIEAKMGNNPELKNAVVSQLDGYVDCVKLHIEELRDCYEENYRQQKLLGLIGRPTVSAIQIVDDVRGMIVVSGYSGQVKKKVDDLKQQCPTRVVVSGYSGQVKKKVAALTQQYPTVVCKVLDFSL